MEIEIKRVITNEFHNGNFETIDLNHLEDFLNEKFFEKDYGKSVVKYFLGFELYKFDGRFAPFFSNDIESWKTNSKWFVTNAHFDWNQLINLNQEETLEIIKASFLQSVDRIANMKRKPKDFDYMSFSKDLKIILDQYKVN